ncbi:MAG: hypothetical protein ACRCSF_01765 [Mycobacteriaceae bacterium]
MGSINRLLDNGAKGLEYFSTFLPLAEKLGLTPKMDDGSPVTLEKIYGWYDDERSMDIECLEADIALLGNQLKELTEKVSDQYATVGTLASVWEGQGSAAAVDLLSQHAACAAGDLDFIRDVQVSLAQLSSSLTAAVTQKTEAILALNSGPVVDNGPGVIEKFILANELNGGSTLFSTGRWDFGITREYVNDVFAQDLQSRYDAFAQICASTNTTIEQCFALIADTMSTIASGKYPSPVGGEFVAQLGAGSAGSGGVGEQSIVGAPHSSPQMGGTLLLGSDGSSLSLQSAADIPQQLISALPGIVDGVRSVVDQVVGAVDSAGVLGDTGESSVLGQVQGGLSTTISAVIDSAVQALSDKAPEDPNLSVNLDQTHIDMHKKGNSAIIIELTGPDGVVRTYEMTIGEGGEPKLTEVKAIPEVSGAVDGGVAGADSSYAPQPVVTTDINSEVAGGVSSFAVQNVSTLPNAPSYSVAAAQGVSAPDDPASSEVTPSSRPHSHPTSSGTGLSEVGG